jgi:aminoglycoside phosphotransferase (APT) family kinase protein
VPQALPALERLDAWLLRNTSFRRAHGCVLERFEGGVSNITCRLEVDGEPSAVVVRVQRDRGIFEPYDVLREARVLDALAGTNVPVPRVLAREQDTSVLGAPFVLLEWIDAPHMGEAGPEASFPAFVEMVARIHAVDWQAAGLQFLGVPESPERGLALELNAIERRLSTFVPEQVPLLQRGLERLRADIPGDGRVALCQGDINVFNYLFRHGKVVAVVDWEQARLSDPRSDLGQLLALSHLKGAPLGPASASPFLQLYGAAAGGVPGGMEWFRARWLWELGVIYHGWVAFNGTQPWYDWDLLAGLLDAALAEI